MRREFVRLAQVAERCGWSGEEVAYSLMNLALTHIYVREAAFLTDEAIRRAVNAASNT